MGWKLLQLTIFVSVLSSNGYYHWTPNGFAASVVAFVCAFGATVLLSDLFRFLTWAFQRLWPLLPQKGADNRHLPR